MLCSFILTGAKQGQLSYITDNVTLTRKTPARVLYGIRKSITRIQECTWQHTSRDPCLVRQWLPSHCKTVCHLNGILFCRTLALSILQKEG